MKLKAINPQTYEQRTIMKLLMAYSSEENKSFYDVFCQARKRSNLMALYDQGKLLGCLLLGAHKNYLMADCLLKDTVFAGEDIEAEIKKMLKLRYPEHAVCLALRSYQIS